MKKKAEPKYTVSVALDAEQLGNLEKIANGKPLATALRSLIKPSKKEKK